MRLVRLSRQLLSLAVGIAVAAGCGGDGSSIVDAAGDGGRGDGGIDEVDAAADASAIDASGGDGGGGDGDASAIDAAAIDASAVDAAAIDASAIDAAAIDAAAIDASAIDASAIDAAAIDASAIDAAAIDAAAIDAAAIDAEVDAPIDAAIDGPVDASVPVTFAWADWTSSTTGAPGAAAGVLLTSSGPVMVTYAGEVAFAQTAGGANYWVPGAPYVNTVTANPPGDPDIIALNNAATVNTLTFSPPVNGLVLAVVSLGAPGSTVRYHFDRPITLLSYGAGYWGNGTLVIENGDTLAGTEGHGAIQFPGPVSSVSWTLSGGEFWHGFTVGIPDL